MAASRAVLGLIALLAVLATLYVTVIAASGGAGHAGTSPAGAAQPSPGAYSNAINNAQGAVGQANADAQRAAGTSVGP